MASTRCQKTRGKSLCMTDFYDQSAQSGSVRGTVVAKRPMETPKGNAHRGAAGTGARSPASGAQNSPRSSPPSPNSSLKGNGLKRGPSIPISANTTMGEPHQVSNPTSLPTSSPEKHHPRLDSSSESSREAFPPSDPTENPTDDLLAGFPTSNQAASESVIKDLMLALRSSIQQSFTAT